MVKPVVAEADMLFILTLFFGTFGAFFRLRTYLVSKKDQ
jgi:hypothetical protein